MALEAKNVSKVLGEARTQVLSDISLKIESGEFVSLVGRSGSGKSSLLYLLSTLDSPSSGSIEIDGIAVSALNDKKLDHLRNEKIGFVFQFHYLLAELTAFENVLMPARAKGKLDPQLKLRASELLERVGLGEKQGRLPRQMSGGEQQRVAIARALLLKPRYLFADEPTGALDSVNAAAVMKILRGINSEEKTTVVLVTHDADFAASADRQIRLADGRVVPN